MPTTKGDGMPMLLFDERIAAVALSNIRRSLAIFRTV